MLQNLLGKFRKDPNTPINKLYLLVHPFYDFYNTQQIKEFKDIWMDSISDASKDGDALAITYFAGLPSDRDKPNKFKFYFDKPSENELEIGKHVQQSFGKNRSKFVLIQNIYPYIVWTYDENIESRIVDPKLLTITARGVYAERCVNDGKLAAIEAYKVPKENSSIVFQESIFGEEHIAKKHGFPKHIRKWRHD